MSLTAPIIGTTGGTETADATAEQWHIKSGKTAYIASGKVTGNAYTPAMMEFDGSSGYYSASFTTSGDLATAHLRFKRAAFTGGSFEYLYRCEGPTGDIRIGLFLGSSDHATAGYRNKLIMVSQNSSGTNIARLVSSSDLVDGAVHEVHAAFSATTGAALFYVDGSDEDDTGSAQRVAPTTGTLDSGASSNIYVGSSNGTLFFSGEIGRAGYRDAYLTNWSDFMQSDGSPKDIESTLSTVWGATPQFWNPHGDMVNNLGSAGAVTKNGTINVGNGGAT